MAGPQTEALRQQTRRVFEQALTKANGSQANLYATLVREFAAARKKSEREPGPVTWQRLEVYINTLKEYVSLIREHQHESLLAEVLGIKFRTTGPGVRAAVLDFIATLVVVNTAFTHTCLRLLVASLLPHTQQPVSTDSDAQLGPWQPSEEDMAVQHAITETLIKVLSLVPTAPVSLMQLVSTHMPHKLRDRDTQCMFLSAVFRLAEAPAGRPVRDALLATVVEHLLTLDVDIRWEDISDKNHTDGVAEEQEAEEDPDLVFQLEGMHELDLNASPEQLEQIRQQRLDAQAAGPRGGWEGAAAGAAGATAADGGAKPVDELANKLDSLMELAFQHLEHRCTLPGAGGPAQTWSALMSSFERTILNTHRSKFSQYLVFYMCYKYPEPCVRLFAEFLITRLQDPALPPITRSACAAYLASFIARATAAKPQLALACVDALARFTQHYAVSADGVATPRWEDNATATAAVGTGEACVTTKHQVFYATVQAILYILCFHMDAMLTTPTQQPHHTHHHHHHHHSHHGDKAVREARAQLQAVLSQQLLPVLLHPLRPLRVCLSSVVLEFGKQLKKHGFTDVHSRLNEALGDAHLTAPSTTARTAQRPLEMFFPFDPYLLERSSRYLNRKASYVEWRKGGARARVGTAGAAGAAGAGGESDSGEESDSECESGSDESESGSEGEEDTQASGTAVGTAIKPVGKRVSASARGAHNGSSPLQDITDQSDDDLAGVLPDASGDLSDDDESASTSSSDTEGGSVRDNSLPSGANFIHMPGHHHASRPPPHGTDAAAATWGGRGGHTSGKRGRSTVYDPSPNALGTSYDLMGTSMGHSVGHMSTGGMSPAMGQSPLGPQMVEYDQHNNVHGATDMVLGMTPHQPSFMALASART